MKTKANAIMIGLATIGAGTAAGADSHSQAGRAIPIYNQAYQENYEPDQMADLLANARNGYVLLDPFQGEDDALITANVATLRTNGNDVGAYISIGTGEEWRDDFAQLQPYLVTLQWGEWPGEYFISTPNDAVLSIMKARIDRIAAYGFNWVEFDNMDWASDDESRATYAMQASAADGVAYYQALCAHVHSLGMKCMAKSTVDEAGDFDGVVYESYTDDLNWWDQDGALSFLAQGKLVIINHYDDPDCAAAYDSYKAIYGPNVSFICESADLQRYVHFNE